MSVDDFTNILKKIDKVTTYLYFHVKGEPLLHPEIGQLLDLSHEKGFKVNLTTNGSNISEMSDLLLTKPALRQISFSLQSIEVYSDNEAKEKYLKAVLEFVKKAIMKTNMTIELRLWNINLEEIQCKQLDAVNAESQNETITSIETNPHNIFTNSGKAKGNTNNNTFRIIEEELNLPFVLNENIMKAKGVKISDRVYLSQSQVFEWPDMNVDPISTTGFCYGLRNQIAVLVDGTVIPCCLDSDGVISLGNIFESTISDILESNRAKDIYNGFSNRRAIEPLCQRCGYRSRFESD
jgi:radical SAM protein with 4Fe4S-binding SPASM domain